MQKISKSKLVLAAATSAAAFGVPLVGAGSALAAPVEKVSAFVCPVIPSEAVGEHNPQAGPLGDTGTYTVVPATANNGHLMVPVTATNGDGNGHPGTTQSQPGDTDYTAIWSR